MLKTHNKYRSLSLLLTLGVVVGQLFPVLADDELPTVETIPETQEFDSSGNLGTDDNNGFGEDFGDENPDNDGFGSDDQEPSEVPVTTPEPSAPPVNNSGATPEPPAATEPGENDPTEPVTDPSEQRPQPVTLTGNAEDGKIKVETATTTTVLPADAFIQADLIKDEQRTAIIDGLKDSKYSIDGILPIDIFFLVKNPESNTADPIPLPEESTVDLKFSVNKELIHSDKDIDWNSVEVVKVTKNDEGKYEKKTLIENKDLKLAELPVESEPVDQDTDPDQNTEPTEDTDSDPVQKSASAQTTESGTVTKETAPENQDPAKPSASSKTEGTAAPETTEETTEFEQAEGVDKVDPADANTANADESSAQPSQAYQGTVTLDGATQIALTWKNKKSSLIGSVIQDAFEIVDGIADFIQGIDKEMDDIKLPSALNNEVKNSLKKDESTFIDLSNSPSLELPQTSGASNNTVTFYGQTGNVVVSASTTSDILPADADMEVSMIDANRTEYEAAVDALEEHSIEYGGVKIVDISFWKDGQEIEPENGLVNIQMSFDKDLLGGDIESGTVEVHHIVEESEKVTVQSVATEANKTIAENKDQSGYDAEFGVDHFSMFAITYAARERERKKVKFNPNNGDEPFEVSVESGGCLTFPEFRGKDSDTFGGQTITYKPIGWAIIDQGMTNGSDGWKIYQPREEINIDDESDVTYWQIWDRVYYFVQLEGVIPEEPTNSPPGRYSIGIPKVDDTTPDKWIVDSKVNDLALYDGIHLINNVTNSLDSSQLPTEAQISSVCEFNSDDNYIHWYVRKWQNNGLEGDALEYSWHIDGVKLDSHKLNVAHHRNCDDNNVKTPNGYQVAQKKDGSDIKVGYQNGTAYFDAPSRTGYKFLGWTLNSDYKEEDQLYKTGVRYTVKKNTDFYAQWEPDPAYCHSLTIKKTVSGNFGNRDHPFQFTVSVFDADGKPYAVAAQNNKNVKYDSASNTYKFSLKNNENIELKIPYHGKYTITETPEGYVPSLSINNGTAIKGTDNDVSFTTGEQSITENTNVVFTNTKESTVPSGLNDGNHHAFTLMIGAGLAAMLGLLATKAYRRMNGI